MAAPSLTTIVGAEAVAQTERQGDEECQRYRPSRPPGLQQVEEAGPGRLFHSIAPTNNHRPRGCVAFHQFDSVTVGIFGWAMVSRFRLKSYMPSAPAFIVLPCQLGCIDSCSRLLPQIYRCVEAKSRSLKLLSITDVISERLAQIHTTRNCNHLAMQTSADNFFFMENQSAN